MSLFKKISIALLSLVAIFSLAFMVSAQATNTSDNKLIEATPEQLAESNNLPSIEITNISLPKEIYSSGDQIVGTFMLDNDRNYGLPDLKYKISLVGDYNKGLANVFYDSKLYGPVFLKASEKKLVNFNYSLPKNVAGAGLGIQIQFYTSTGYPLSWANKLIQVQGSTTILSIASADVSIGEKKYGLQDGPTLSANKIGTLNVVVRNTFDSKQVLTPEIKIYGRTVTGKMVKELKAEPFTVLAKSDKSFSWDVAYIEKAGVYEASVNFINKDGDRATAPVLFRYIVDGQIAAIQYVLVDKSILKSGENYNLKVAYTGTPYDIDADPAGVSAKNTLNLNIVVSDENKKVVSEYKNTLDFKEQGIFDIPMVTSGPTQRLFFDIKVTDAEGNIITTWSNEVIQAPVQASNINIIYYFGFALFLILIVIGIFFFQKKKIIGLPIIVLFLCFFFSIVAPDSASANTVNWTGGAKANTRTYPDFTLSTPASTVSPGEVFDVTGVSTIYSCANSNGHTLVETSDIYSSNSYTYANQPNWVYSSGDIKSGTGGEGIYTNNISLGSYTAPTTPGDYYIFLLIKAKWGNNDYYSMQHFGYIKFTVSTGGSSPALTVTPTCADPTITWQADGFRMSAIYKNGVLMATSPINTGSYTASGLSPNHDVISVVALNQIQAREVDYNYKSNAAFCWGNCPPSSSYTISYGSRYCEAYSGNSLCRPLFPFQINPFQFINLNVSSYNIYSDNSLSSLLTSTEEKVYTYLGSNPQALKVMAIPNAPYKGMYKGQEVYFTLGDGYSVPVSYTCPNSALQNGACGTASGVALASAPTTGLCSVGTPSTVTRIISGEWRWSCTGLNGGLTIICNAPVSTAPTCSDGIRNQDETGVDTGGVCGGGGGEIIPGGGGAGNNGGNGSGNRNGLCNNGIGCGGNCPLLCGAGNLAGDANSASCPVSRTGTVSANNQTSINTNTTWSVTIPASCIGCTIKWKAVDNNNLNPAPVDGSTVWNKIFTTVGLKKISAEIYLSGAKICSSNIATTSVTQSGIIIEQ